MSSLLYPDQSHAPAASPPEGTFKVHASVGPGGATGVESQDEDEQSASPTLALSAANATALQREDANALSKSASNPRLDTREPNPPGRCLLALSTAKR